MNIKNLQRFNLLSQKAANENATLDELRELRKLLSSLNNVIELELPEVIKHFNNSTRTAKI